MKTAVLAVVLLFSASIGVFGQNCDILQARSPSQIGMNLCTGKTFPQVGDKVLIEAGSGQIVTQVTSSALFTVSNQQIVVVSVTDPAKAQENMLLLVGVDTATIKFGDNSLKVAVQHDAAARNFHHYDWSVGPATKSKSNSAASGGGSSTAADSNSSDTGAFRFRYSGEYESGGVFGQMKGSSPQTTGPLLQTTASLAIDTTDQNSQDYIDNNKVSLGLGASNLSFGRLWMHGKLGIEGNLEKAFHQDVRNVDAVVTASGWVPVLRSLTLLSKNGEFIAAPLSFEASYGYRDHRQEGISTRGRVFEGSAHYNLFLFDQFQLSLSATLTNNDLDHPLADVPTTQRLYKATIAYLENPKSGFKVLTSIEDGSAGVMLRKVRQYFIGIALSKLNLNGSGGD